MDLRGSVAIVTGGSGGLGAHICHALASEGVNVMVGYNSNHENAESLVRALRVKGVKSEIIKFDVTDVKQIKVAVDKTVMSFGRIDILINDAAYNKFIPFENLEALTYEEWSKILDVNLTGPMRTIKAVANIMKSNGSGRIVNISSVAGLSPRGSSIAYAVSKAGLNHLTRCMAISLAPEILVNCVAPGVLEGTKMSRNLTPEYRKHSIENSVLKKVADKDDIANQVVEFCRTDSTTGQTIVIDSGMVFN